MTTVNIDLSSPVAQKDKDATRTYRFDLAGILYTGDALATVSWTVPAGLTLVSSSFSGTSCEVQVSGGVELQWYAVIGAYLTEDGEADQIVLRLFIKQDAEDVSALGTALFPNRFTAVAALRRDRLVMAAAGIAKGVEVSDDYLWDKLRAAEAEVAHALRVPLKSTQFFPSQPTQPEIDALALAGTPWEIDPGYDYQPDFFHSDRWGFIPLRHKPVTSVSKVRITFPSAAATTYYDIPADWIRADKKYGLLQFVPTSGANGSPLNAFMLNVFGMGRNVPFSIQVTYVAGLANAGRDFPDLVDLVQKKAVLKTLEDRFLPQSGSISADGLSQSVSVDMEKYRDTADAILNGPKGTNGGLMAAIHGVRTLVF